MKRKTKQNKGITLIKKSNQLIEARYKFDVWETRIFLSVLSFIRREDEDFKTYRIWYKDVIKTFGLTSGQSYGFLRDASRSLMRKVFNVSNEENGFQRETEYHIIRSVNFLSEGEKGRGVEYQEYIDITFDPQMKPMLLQLQRNFTAYDLRNVVKLGTYPVRIYELLKQYESIGERTLGFEEMKRMFELSEEYPLFGNFFQKVIAPSVREVNLHTDLNITKVEKLKEGKKITALRFVFQRKTEEELRTARGELIGKSLEIPFPNPSAKETSMERPETEKDKLFNLFHADVVQKFGVTPSVFMELLDGCTEEQVAQAIRVTRRAKAQNQIKSSIAGFFVQALKGGFTDPKEEELKRRATEEQQMAKREEIRLKLETLKGELAGNINDKIRELTTANPDLTNQAIEALYENPVSKSVIDEQEKTLFRELTIEDFRQERILREMVKAKIVELERDNFSPLYDSYEESVALLKAASHKFYPNI
ncbi:MAG: RepB family plasmid replication initiator protein [Saprospiraceae bacterium]|nr:RepB family plasmid replication initiator protein [Saprospiraceae bacterium]